MRNAHPVYVNMLIKKYKCKPHIAELALSLREGIMVFAEEYIERRDLPEAMDISDRYPKWHQYQTEKRRV